jgi:hypothetical protein
MHAHACVDKFFLPSRQRMPTRLLFQHPLIILTPQRDVTYHAPPKKSFCLGNTCAYNTTREGKR